MHEFWFLKIRRYKSIESTWSFVALIIGRMPMKYLWENCALILVKIYTLKFVKFKKLKTSMLHTTSLSPSRIPKICDKKRIYIRRKSLENNEITKESPACPLAKVFGMHGTTTDTFLSMTTWRNSVSLYFVAKCRWNVAWFYGTIRGDDSRRWLLVIKDI